MEIQQQNLTLNVAKTTAVLRDKKLTVGFAESCTGGLLSSLFTELAGVSDVFLGSVISYDNHVKQRLLNVAASSLVTDGAVSTSVAKQMAEGAVKALEVSVAVSITGVAGPSGGTTLKPVGTVFIAVAGLQSETKVFEHHFGGDRKQIQLQSCGEAIKHLDEFIKRL
ncbi:MAG: CinA family protein [Bdellovibrionaceae bacterium]|nr:CinA family protein [Bdellovibrio sp.]